MPSPLGLVPVLHAASAWYMAGVIWFVQLVHYPSFGWMPPAAVPAYQQRNTRFTGVVVGPPMLIELGAAGWLLVADPRPLTALGAALLALIWISTALLQVPAHGRLARRFEPAVHRRLVRTNWIRTVGWTVRAIIAASLLR